MDTYVCSVDHELGSDMINTVGRIYIINVTYVTYITYVTYNML